jgi:hypothetical protein
MVDDIAIIYKSFNLDVPNDLQNKVFVDFMLFYCNRGRENLRELKKTDFTFHGSGDNKYIALRDHSTKNHRGDSKDDNESHVMPSRGALSNQISTVFFQLALDAAKNNHNQGVAQTSISQMI